MFYFTVDVGPIIIREINVWNGIICWGIHKIQLSNDIGKVYRYLTESGIYENLNLKLLTDLDLNKMGGE